MVDACPRSTFGFKFSGCQIAHHNETPILSQHENLRYIQSLLDAVRRGARILPLRCSWISKEDPMSQHARRVCVAVTCAGRRARALALLCTALLLALGAPGTPSARAAQSA